MDVYRRGGDSLQGRYHHYRLHPFTLSEMLHSIPTIEILGELQFAGRKRGVNEYNALKTLSGFPEPLFSGSERTYRRWQKERVDRFVREDVRDLETVKDLASLETLLDLLPALLLRFYTTKNIFQSPTPIKLQKIPIRTSQPRKEFASCPYKIF